MDKLRDFTPRGGLDSGFGKCDSSMKVGHGGDETSVPETKKVECRAEIDTSPPFGSVEEAVTRFGGRGFWIPLHKLGDAYHGIEEVDINKVEQQAAELERDLMAKQQETLDVLKELEATKRFVEDLRLKLQILDLHEDDQKISASPPAAIKEMNKENSGSSAAASNLNHPGNSSPDLILMELKQAKLNLSKTTNDLAVIRDSVESLNRKMKQEKCSLEKNQEKMVMNSRMRPQAALSLEGKGGFENPTNISRELQQLNSEAEQFIKMAEAAKFEVLRAMSGIEQTKTTMKTAEMRWVAAKKMEEAARAAEAVALAEIRALSGGSEASSGVFMQKPDGITLSFRDYSSIVSNSQRADDMTPRKKAVDHPMILKKLEEATEEVAVSKNALEEALNRVETANRRKLAVEEALQRLKMDHHHNQRSRPVQNSQLFNGDTRPVLRPSISIGDALSRKLMIPEEFGVREGHKKVSLSQMLHKQSGALSPPPPPPPPATASEKEDEIDLKQYFAKSRKFGFIHLSLPMARQSKKKMQAANLR
ncbi:hypothetical protein PVL29_016467 [Vitis rotundifolia]|uniref:WEB family protein n=1 Tax=Vitis rotundifolia TaxID=103349 RepID=A0AA38Z7S0_VITRO|nr:hypothetical protein PVL29_016467 [Vitis rotundifolia]